MDKETSSAVSTLAAEFINFRPLNLTEIIDSREPDLLAEFCTKVRTLAGSAMSQDQTPGQGEIADGFLGRLKKEHSDLSNRYDRLAQFLRSEISGDVSDRQIELLGNQAAAMAIYRNVLQLRIDDLEKADA